MAQVIFGYLVNPLEATIRRVEIKREKVLQGLYDWIGCIRTQAVMLDENHDIWIDEDGWLTPARAAIEVHTTKGRLLAGRGVILAHNAEGESVSPQFPIEHFREQIDAIQPVMSAQFESFNEKLADGTLVFGERLSKITTHAIRVSLSITD